MFVKGMSRVLAGAESEGVIAVSIHSNRPGSVVVQSEWFRSTTGRVVAASGRLAVDSNITYRLDYVDGVFFFELGDKYILSEAIARIIDFVFARKGCFVHDQVTMLEIKDIDAVNGPACLERARALSISREIDVTRRVVKAMNKILPSIKRRVREYSWQMRRLGRIADPSVRARRYEVLKRHYDAEVGRLRRRSIEAVMLKSRLRLLKQKRRTYARH